MKQSVWIQNIADAVEESASAELRDPRRSIDRVQMQSIATDYSSTINTLQTLASVSDETKEHTEVFPSPEQESIQFVYTDKSSWKDHLEGIALIKQILDEDIPIKRGFQPDYTIQDNSIIVESPELEMIQIFDSVRSPLWRLTGVYEKNGLYKHRYQQRPLYDESEDPIEKYATNRIISVSRSVSFPCSECDGSISFRPDRNTARKWNWECEDCSKAYSTHELSDLTDPINPVWTRRRIQEEIRQHGLENIQL
jgi:predicted RNA-binding Zn-ribbon protein involved in translation (DUF1610 family)